LQQGNVTTLHDLKAAAKIRSDPGANEGQPLRQTPTNILKSRMDSLGILMAKRLNHHKLHNAAFPSQT